MNTHFNCIQDTLSSRALGLAFRPSASREQRYLAYNHFSWVEFIADKCGTIRFLQNGLIDNNWIVSQIDHIMFLPPNLSKYSDNALNSTKPSKWVVDQHCSSKGSRFRHFWCSDLQYITSARFCAAYITFSIHTKCVTKGYILYARYLCSHAHSANSPIWYKFDIALLLARKPGHTILMRKRVSNVQQRPMQPLGQATIGYFVCKGYIV